VQSEDDIQRRRRMMREAMNRGLQRPQSSSFMPGESAGMPDSFWEKKFPFLKSTAALTRSQPGYAPIGGEQLPDGRDTQDLLRPGRERSPLNISRLNPDAGLSLPQPASPTINTSVVPPPSPSQPLAPTPPPRIGYSTAGLTGTEALMQRRRALEEADPESKVTPTGEILPPEKTGRWKGLGQGLLLAGAQANSDRPMYALGQVLGGGISGAVSPRGSAKVARKFELGQLDNDIARGLKLEGMEQDVRGPKLGQMSTRVVQEGEYPGIDAGTEIRVRVDPRTGAVTDVVGPNNRPVVSQSVQRAGGAPHYEKDADGYLITVQGGRAQRVMDEAGKPVQVRGGKDGEEYVEVEVNGRKLRVTPGQALSYYGQLGQREEAATGDAAKRQAHIDASSSLYKKADANDANATALDEHIKKLEAGMATMPEGSISAVEKDASGNSVTRTYPSARAPFEKQINELKEQQRKLREQAATWRAEGDKERAAGEAIPVRAAAQPTQQPYAGRTMTRANLERYAKDKGLTVEQAQKQVESQGVRIQ
jgi:hypothetical protein